MPIKLSHYSRSTTLISLTFAALSIVALIYPPLPVLTLLADSDQYRQMSEQILAGHLLETGCQPPDAQHLAVSLRPPLFPLLLGVASHIPGVDPVNALISLHIILAAFALLATLVLTGTAIKPLLTIAATGIALFSAKQVAWGVMSEWLAMVWLFLACTAYLSWISRPSWQLALAVSLCTSLAILTRTALLPWLAIPVFMVLQAPRGGHRGTATGLLAGLLPLFLWGAINCARTGAFALVRYEGLNLVATARSLGPIPFDSRDSEDQQHLITTINAQGSTAPDSAFKPTEVHRWDGEFYRAFHANFDQVTAAMQTLSDASVARPTSIAARGLRAHADRYRLFLKGGVQTLIAHYLPLVGLCLVAALWLWRRAPHHARWSLGVITIAAVTLGYLCIIFTSMLWLHRYFIPVQPILLFCLVVSGVQLVGTFVVERGYRTFNREG